MLLFFHIIYLGCEKLRSLFLFLRSRNNAYLLTKYGVKYNPQLCNIHPNSKIIITNGGVMRIGNGFICRSFPQGIGNFNGSKIIVKGGTLVIGIYSGFSNIALYCCNKIIIGDYVNIGDGVMIFDTNFHSTNWRDRSDRITDINNSISKPIYIKDSLLSKENILDMI